MASLTIPSPLPSPMEDAKGLWKAFEGWGKDDKALTEILGHRSSGQIGEIARAYEEIYKEKLIDRLESEFRLVINIFFKDTILQWTTPPAERDAKYAKKAITQYKGDRGALMIVEIACASSPNHLMAIRKSFCDLYSCSLEESIAYSDAFKEPVRELLVRLESSYRYNGDNTDIDSAKLEAAKFYDAIQKDHLLQEEIMRFISLRSKSHLKAMAEHYSQEYCKSMDEAIVNSTSPFSGLMKTVLWCLVTPEKHFAEVLRKSMDKLGTDEDILTRAVVSRAEIDMENIKEEYMKRYNVTLTHDILDDTSGPYRDLLLALVGPEKEQ
ncbi:hypothetical protein LUZ60_003662 [Juncus effusus]|nr:hypothetical protein LUZ60_003662 [Juncus effusus]